MVPGVAMTGCNIFLNNQGTHMHGLSLKAAPEQKDFHMLLHMWDASQPHHEPVIWLENLWVRNISKVAVLAL